MISWVCSVKDPQNIQEWKITKGVFPLLINASMVALKGTVEGDGFWAWSIPYSLDGKNLKKINTWIITNWDIHTFMFLGVARESGEALYVFFIYHKYSFRIFSEYCWYFLCIRRRFCVLQTTYICHILHIHLNTFWTFSKYKYAKILSALSPPLNTSRVFSEYAETSKCRITQQYLRGSLIAALTYLQKFTFMKVYKLA